MLAKFSFMGPPDVAQPAHRLREWPRQTGEVDADAQEPPIRYAFRRFGVDDRDGRPPLLSLMLAWAGAAAAHDVGVGLLPIGDGKISREPKAGNVYACPMGGGPRRGADASVPGPRTASGSRMPKPARSKGSGRAGRMLRSPFTLEGSQRVVRANGLPRSCERACSRSTRSPIPPTNTIETRTPVLEQTVLLRLPFKSDRQQTTRPSCVPDGCARVSP
jgi:hypothetical protein